MDRVARAAVALAPALEASPDEKAVMANIEKIAKWASAKEPVKVKVGFSAERSGKDQQSAANAYKAVRVVKNNDAPGEFVGHSVLQGAPGTVNRGRDGLRIDLALTTLNTEKPVSVDLPAPWSVLGPLLGGEAQRSGDKAWAVPITVEGGLRYWLHLEFEPDLPVAPGQWPTSGTWPRLESVR
jgi:hypothetical protein